ncbi:aspartate kinase [Rickettsia sp. MEAM1 (Bemisia tabaci)]|uniref:aspartate kinase n=1 Tax=unclassified Rickettsia TaxID=114295 RepID=UPI000309DDD3|nr:MULTISPECIES: aspartate kinase [unclassified Rickettsia]ASX27995.1 aspartate kinase [Rickettsia sp. MEAM1 (Bemisia tabaci)]ODA36427.1 aspartate kinase [Rickettsia sp. wb]ODA37081.1 aspartate kinase [Rickettsia sp. wq]
MALIIQKFGGTSVATIDRIKKIIPTIKAEIAKNNQVIIAVSAMAGVTNQLVTLCNEVSSLNKSSQLAEYDVALSSGEIVTASLLALALQEENINARSFLAWQLPILTDDNHSKALVESVDTNLLNECLQQNIIPIIAGFQGINKHNRLATLGRGGSDTTAALIAAAMKADRCDIYTDVEGVFAADPRIIPKAKKIDEIDFSEMLELALSGAKVLHPRAAEIVMRYQIDMRILSTFAPEAGCTLITSKDKIMEKRIISGITSNKNLLYLTIESCSLNFIQVASVIAQNNNHIELIQEIEHNKRYSFITNLTDKNSLHILLTNLKNNNQISNFTFDTEIATVSIIGHGIKNDLKLLEVILSKLAKDNINVQMVQISEIKIILLINDKQLEKTVLDLYDLLKISETEHC